MNRASWARREEGDADVAKKKSRSRFEGTKKHNRQAADCVVRGVRRVADHVWGEGLSVDCLLELGERGVSKIKESFKEHWIAIVVSVVTTVVFRLLLDWLLPTL